MSTSINRSAHQTHVMSAPSRFQIESRGCLEHILALRAVMEMFGRKKQRLHLVFLDAQKANDTVQHAPLLDAMAARKIPWNFVRIVHSCLRGCQRRMLHASSGHMLIASHVFEDSLRNRFCLQHITKCLLMVCYGN
jgi:hypothetical protein